MILLVLIAWLAITFILFGAAGAALTFVGLVALGLANEVD